MSRHRHLPPKPFSMRAAMERAEHMQTNAQRRKDAAFLRKKSEQRQRAQKPNRFLLTTEERRTPAQRPEERKPTNPFLQRGK